MAGPYPIRTRSGSPSSTHNEEDGTRDTPESDIGSDDETSSSGSSSSSSSSGDYDDSTNEDEQSEDGSSDEESSSSEDEDRVQLPRSAPLSTAAAPDLSSRLASFLPTMRAANANLARDVSEGQGAQHSLEVDEDDEEEPHVDMNLGLGVLEERKEGSVTSGSGDGGEDDLEEAEVAGPSNDGVRQSRKRKAGVLDTLLRREKRPKPEIEEVGE